jgi:hypothetical protein
MNSRIALFIRGVNLRDAIVEKDAEPFGEGVRQKAEGRG